MKRTHAPGILTMLVLAASFSSLAAADESGWYDGMSVGRAKAKIDDARIISGLLAGRLSTLSITDDDRDTGFKVFGGYQFNRNFAVEGGYFDLGKFGFVANTSPIGSLTGEIKIRGLNLDLVGRVPITDRFSAFGRVGANYAQARDSFRGTGRVHVLNPNPKVRDTNLKFGGGLQYALSEFLDLRAEVERYRINDAVGNRGDVDLVSVGLVYRFGGRHATPVMRASAPEPVAPMPRAIPPEAPAAAVVSTSPAVPTQPATIRPPVKTVFASDALFDFDKSLLRPEGKTALTRFATDLRSQSYEVITVTGHADRLGSQQYNRALSMRRAESVKSYLIEPAGIIAAKISTVAVDESQPITKPGDCIGSKATPKLIACLQPDRRVEIQVTGTRQP